MKNNRLRILDIKDSCTACGACVSSCPKQALQLAYDDEGFYFPQLNVSKCVDCKSCEKVCHVLRAPRLLHVSQKYKAFMVKANDAEIVKSSSSGGVFTILANYVLSKKGVVFGARYNFDKERLEHCSTDNCSLIELRKSKYIESYVGTSFKEVLTNLKNERMVLFCGTPCQIDGLSQFLRTRQVNTKNLLLVRFVCHGVPSNKFFAEYKHFEERKYGSKMNSFDFRPKTRGGRNSDWKMSFENGKTIGGPYYYFYYYYHFQLSNMLRKSCYFCKRVYQETADITIADFWGIYDYRPSNKDQEGISLVLDHTGKFKALFSHIKNECVIEEVPLSSLGYIYEEAKDREPLYTEREKLMESVLRRGYVKTAQRELRRSIIKWKVKNFIKKIIGLKI